MKMNRRKSYSDAFKTEAVRRVLQDGKTAAEVTREMGTPKVLLGKWLRRARELGMSAPDRLTETDQERLVKAEREVERLRLENEILKKAAAFFARSLP